MLPEGDEIVAAYRRFCHLRADAKDKPYVDFSGVRFMYPTTLLAVSIFMLHEDKKLRPSEDQSFTNYLLLITGGLPPGHKHNKTYMAIEELPHDPDGLVHLTDRINRICKGGEELGGKSAFTYYVSELLQNVYDHARAEHAYFMVQRYPKKGFVEMALVDDGITIPGSYEEANTSFSDAIEALQMALEGISTKDVCERGFGLGTSARLVSALLGGQFFLASGSGAFLLDISKKKFFKLSQPQALDGTLITLRIPYPAPSVRTEDLYDVIGG